MIRLLIFVTLVACMDSAFHSVFTLAADSISGNWKRSAMTILNAKGKTTDALAVMQRAMPCSKDIIYIFSSDGGVTSKVPESCGAMKQTLESSNTTGRWTISGNKLTITPTRKDLPVVTYTVSFQGDRMSWVFDFADNPKAPNPTKAQRMTIEYKRV